MSILDWVEDLTQSVLMFVEHWKLYVIEENNVVPNENSVERKPYIKRESNIIELTI